MAVYRSFYCGKCEAELVNDTSISSVGTTHIICSKCSHGNRTKASPFSYKNTWGKVYTFIEAYISFKFFLFWFLPVAISIYVFTNNIETLTISLMIAVGVRTFFLIKKIKEVEIRQKEIEKELGIEPV